MAFFLEEVYGIMIPLMRLLRMPSTSAHRQTQHRERRRRGLRCLTIEIRSQEITELVRRGLLADGDQGSRQAVVGAVHRLLDQTLG